MKLLSTREQQEVAERAASLCAGGLSCSESVLRAVGGALLEDPPAMLFRAASPFSGGFSGEELCGALSGGLMAIGALHGRLEATENKDRCKQLSVTYRNAFISRFGTSQCKTLKAKGWGMGSTSCSVLVGEATSLLLTVLSES